MNLIKNTFLYYSMNNNLFSEKAYNKFSDIELLDKSKKRTYNLYLSEEFKSDFFKIKVSPTVTKLRDYKNAINKHFNDSYNIFLFEFIKEFKGEFINIKDLKEVFDFFNLKEEFNNFKEFAIINQLTDDKEKQYISQYIISLILKLARICNEFVEEHPKIYKKKDQINEKILKYCEEIPFYEYDIGFYDPFHKLDMGFTDSEPDSLCYLDEKVILHFASHNYVNTEKYLKRNIELYGGKLIPEEYPINSIIKDLLGEDIKDFLPKLALDNDGNICEIDNDSICCLSFKKEIKTIRDKYNKLIKQYPDIYNKDENTISEIVSNFVSPREIIDKIMRYMLYFMILATVFLTYQNFTISESKFNSMNRKLNITVPFSEVKQEITWDTNNKKNCS